MLWCLLSTVMPRQRSVTASPGCHSQPAVASPGAGRRRHGTRWRPRQWPGPWPVRRRGGRARAAPAPIGPVHGSSEGAARHGPKARHLARAQALAGPGPAATSGNPGLCPQKGPRRAPHLRKRRKRVGHAASVQEGEGNVLMPLHPDEQPRKGHAVVPHGERFERAVANLRVDNDKGALEVCEIPSGAR